MPGPVMIEIGPCSSCREPMMIAEATYQVLRRSGATFYCPFGHSMRYPPGKSDLEIERERTAEARRRAERAEQAVAEALDRARQNADAARAERHRANGYKGYASRLAARAKAGVCVCCNRTFDNLARHMSSEHPNFTPLEIAQGAQPLELAGRRAALLDHYAGTDRPLEAIAANCAMPLEDARAELAKRGRDV